MRGREGKGVGRNSGAGLCFSTACRTGADVRKRDARTCCEALDVITPVVLIERLPEDLLQPVLRREEGGR